MELLLRLSSLKKHSEPILNAVKHSCKVKIHKLISIMKELIQLKVRENSVIETLDYVEFFLSNLPFKRIEKHFLCYSK